jgi:hypothetical protein
MIRRNGLGASDAAVILGVSPWKTQSELVAEKCSTEITQDELEIGDKPSVRKGAELEPIILKKAQDWFGYLIVKPAPMYRIVEHPYLTLNFDGILEYSGIPVEAKLVTQFAEKYWNKDKALTEATVEPPDMACPPYRTMTPDVINQLAAMCGIPVYYYTQCQQQILAANTDHCFLAALFDKEWVLRVFYVPRNEDVITQLKIEGYHLWSKVTKRKGL